MAEAPIREEKHLFETPIRMTEEKVHKAIAGLIGLTEYAMIMHTSLYVEEIQKCIWIVKQFIRENDAGTLKLATPYHNYQLQIHREIGFVPAKLGQLTANQKELFILRTNQFMEDVADLIGWYKRIQQRRKIFPSLVTLE